MKLVIAADFAIWHFFRNPSCGHSPLLETCTASTYRKKWVDSKWLSMLQCVSQLLRAALQSLFHVKGDSTAAGWKDLTEVQWMQPGGPPHHCMLICQLVRQSIEIWWPQDKTYYKGTVTKYLPDKVILDPPANHA